jgi:hypothetical protein
MIDERLENVVDHQQIESISVESISVESIMYKGKKESIWDGVLRQTWTLKIFGTCSLHPIFCKA